LDYEIKLETQPQLYLKACLDYPVIRNPILAFFLELQANPTSMNGARKLKKKLYVAQIDNDLHIAWKIEGRYVVVTGIGTTEEETLGLG
jgi:hypothetical protein